MCGFDTLIFHLYVAIKSPHLPDKAPSPHWPTSRRCFMPEAIPHKNYIKGKYPNRSPDQPFRHHYEYNPLLNAGTNHNGMSKGQSRLLPTIKGQ